MDNPPHRMHGTVLVDARGNWWLFNGYHDVWFTSLLPEAALHPAGRPAPSYPYQQFNHGAHKIIAEYGIRAPFVPRELAAVVDWLLEV